MGPFRRMTLARLTCREALLILSCLERGVKSQQEPVLVKFGPPSSGGPLIVGFANESA